MFSPYRIGVLGLQGAISEHVSRLKELKQQPVVVKKPTDLHQLDGLIIPGGESTAIWKLIEENHLYEPIQNFATDGKAIFGTCAGLVLLSKETIGRDYTPTLQLMDITVERNGFGRQKDSFESNIQVQNMKESYHAVFIRAPYIDSVGEGVEVIAAYDDKIVAARQKNYLVCAFHPELTDDDRFLEMFINMISSSRNVNHV
ncbi:pyridoxal 5'-phosphate synthase glutaminase subunit PdxT [Oceanobacillus kimchii]|uniref:pyridoxal 5'-phosphate synthase glutaminase subunit PdxT n=1 Tax=Oceanobacillus TaxID=182709 RepID=UPI000344E547|nr:MULTISPECIES: pyridoxal 5'-phosphate synthase glutaminase subunit PdxT [Oceanobacillus]MCT1578193.1 pyridoxal 5'-phosphate synthase glutaminase subunit PdxT [Oceanobacillus kimchii]MCT2134371.1 pyridoxal 5'-phosphate synthase glutaminase subunit PdxT [Oceanobacillus kimchii]OEH55001.1 glutamine amidotransferase [Oceanobacillus sp. E9]